MPARPEYAFPGGYGAGPTRAPGFGGMQATGPGGGRLPAPPPGGFADRATQQSFQERFGTVGSLNPPGTIPVNPRAYPAATGSTPYEFPGQRVEPGTHPWEQTRQDIANIFQHGTTFPEMSTRDILALYGTRPFRVRKQAAEMKRSILAAEIARMMRNIRGPIQQAGGSVGLAGAAAIPQLFPQMSEQEPDF